MADKPPKSVNSELRRVLDQLSKSTPVRLKPDGKFLYRPHLCHANVRDHVAAHGGEAAFGWIVRDLGSDYHFEFHCLWRSPEGVLIDVTPPPKGMKEMMFLPDPARRFDFGTRTAWVNRVWNRNSKTWSFVWAGRRVAVETMVLPRDIEG